MKILFPDNTVLINFAHAGFIEVLGGLIPAAGWCLSVERECRRSSLEPGLESLSAAREYFGDPLVPTGGERINTQLLRDSIAVPGDTSSAHVGEAETVAIVSARGLDAVFATDDRGAKWLAESHGILTVTTWDLIRLAVRLSRMTADEAWTACTHLKSLGRGSPPDCGATRVQFDAWLGA